ncbi:MAG: hypothetical protein RLZZ437_1825 [Pseudomonadota bacterium]
MSDWFRPKAYHSFVLFMLMGICSILLAWLSLGLFMQAVKNVDFLTMHGVMAIMEGGLLQLAIIAIKAAFALVFYLGFKGIEHELLIRWNGHSH